MSSQTQDTGGQVVTTIRLPSDQHRALSALAEANHRSFVGEVRHLIDRRLAEAAVATSQAGHGVSA